MNFYNWIQSAIKCIVLVFCLSLVFSNQTVNAQIGSQERDIALGMLNVTKEQIKAKYYDPTFRGLDLEAIFAQARAKIKDAKTRDELMMIVAQAAMTLDDSHTWFGPPSRSANFEYGWRISMLGGDCFVTAIKTGSDAEAKELKVGDRVVSIDNFAPTRENLWHLMYRYNFLAPAANVRFVVQSPNEKKPHVVDVATKITKTANLITYEMDFIRYLRNRWDISEDRSYEFGKDLMIWKMSTFAAPEEHIDAMMRKAKNFNALILDLRDNGGGDVDTMKRLTGYFTETDLKVADEKKRKSTKPITAKTRRGDAFKGKLIVLVDSNSGSASEIFARTIQLLGRGKIIGDQTAGAVMESVGSTETLGAGQLIYFGVSVTVADIIMPDGKSLEKVGVTPDLLGFPNGQELAEKKDPILSFAAKQFGVEISLEKAGTMFPVKW